MLDQFQRFIKEKHLIPKGKHVLLAVSGGVDSVVMAELFRQSGFAYSIAHANFGLRGKESDGEEAFVKALAGKHRVRFHHKKFDTNAYAEKHGVSIQEAARDLRYEWFEELCKKFNYDVVATAHQLDDSIETFFIHLLRGTGIRGLTGIPVKTKRVIRPLLFASRAEILSFATTNKLSWREDSSNRGDDYLRNRIRHKLIPVLEALQPAFERKMKDNFDQLMLAAHLYSKSIEQYSKKYLQKKKSGGISIDLKKIRKVEFPEAVLSSILHSLGIYDADVAGMLKDDTPGKLFDGGVYRILRDRKTLLLEKQKQKAPGNILVRAHSNKISLDPGTLLLSTKTTPVPVSIPNDPGIQVLDAGKIRFPLLVRPWKAGDSFYPLGMKHRRKLSDFFIDKKISRFDKENCRVVLSGQDIICILGHRIDDRYKVTSSTKKILRLEFHATPA